MDRRELVDIAQAYTDIHRTISQQVTQHPTLIKHPEALAAILGVVVESISDACSGAGKLINTEDMSQVTAYLRGLRAIHQNKKRDTK